MQKKTLILSIVLSFIAVLVIIISNFLYLRHLYSLIKVEPTYLTNTDQIYSSFTNYLKDTVDSRLQLLNCEPKEYYYDDSYFCFVCDDIYPCFGYGWVNRELKRKRNPQTIYITGTEEFEVRIADFCRDGLASKLNCQEINGDYLECEKIRFSGINRNGVFECDEVKLTLKEEIEFKDFAVEFCKVKNEELGEVSESSISCGKYTIMLGENKKILILE